MTATQIEESGGRSDALVAEARSYFDLALLLLEPKPPRLIVIGGLSGSGKTTVAEMLAAQCGSPPGARIIESDRVRKAMFDVVAETRLPADAYRSEISEKVYGEMTSRTSAILRAGGSVVAEAVFDKLPNRRRIEAAARDAHVPCLALHEQPSWIRSWSSTPAKSSWGTRSPIGDELQAGPGAPNRKVHPRWRAPATKDQCWSRST